jgi:hypothetical protein
MLCGEKGLVFLPATIFKIPFSLKHLEVFRGRFHCLTDTRKCLCIKRLREVASSPFLSARTIRRLRMFAVGVARYGRSGPRLPVRMRSLKARQGRKARKYAGRRFRRLAGRRPTYKCGRAANNRSHREGGNEINVASSPPSPIENPTDAGKRLRMPSSFGE